MIIAVFLPCLATLFLPLFVIWWLVRNQPRMIRSFVWGAWGIVTVMAILSIGVIAMQEWITVLYKTNLPNSDYIETEPKTTTYGLRPGAIMPYRIYVEKYAGQYGLDPTLVSAIIQQESAGNADAISSAGAVGLMQIMPITQGDQCPGADLYDPEQNIACGVKHFKWTLDQVGGDTDKAVMAYHSGVTALKTNGPRPIDRQYLTAVNGYWEGMRADRVLVQSRVQVASVPSVDVQSFSSLLSLSSFSDEDGDNEWGPIYKSAVITQGPHGMSYGQYAIDIAAGYGQPVHSPCNCCVIEKFVDEYNNPTLILANGRWRVTFLHGRYAGRVGDCYDVGDVVGTEASIGNSTGPHTHISVFDKNLGRNVDPRNLGLTL